MATLIVKMFYSIISRINYNKCKTISLNRIYLIITLCQGKSHKFPFNESTVFFVCVLNIRAETHRQTDIHTDKQKRHTHIHIYTEF